VESLAHDQAETRVPPRIADSAREAAEWRREHAVPELSEEEAIAVALEAQHELRAKQAGQVLKQ
jgi:hypothetical protein